MEKILVNSHSATTMARLPNVGIERELGACKVHRYLSPRVLKEKVTRQHPKHHVHMDSRLNLNGQEFELPFFGSQSGTSSTHTVNQSRTSASRSMQNLIEGSCLLMRSEDPCPAKNSFDILDRDSNSILLKSTTVKSRYNESQGTGKMYSL